MRLSIVMPVYNEKKTIAPVVDHVMDLKIPDVSIEVVIVDDGSTDGTTEALQTIQKKYPAINVILSEKNQGKGAAVISGISKASGEYVIIQDADLEYDPIQINTVVQPVLRKKAEVVYGTRLNRMPHLNQEESRARFLIHYFGNRFLSLITSMLYGQWITDMETCYKLFPKKAIENMKLNARGFEFEPEITAKLIRAGYRVVEVPITTTPRGYEEGKKLNTIRDGIKALYSLIYYRFSQ